MRKTFLITCLAALLASCSQEVVEQLQPVEICHDLPEGRASGVCFVVNDTAYLFGGRDEYQRTHNELWRYNEASDTWENLGATPIHKRLKPTVCVVGNSVYLGLGTDGSFLEDSTYLSDYWRFTPSTNEWARLADYPDPNVVAAVSLPQGENIYVCYGYKYIFERNVWQYNIALNQWQLLRDDTPRSSNHPPRVSGPVAAVCQNKLYLGTGHHKNGRNFWTEMLPTEGEVHWAEKAAMPDKGRCTAVCTASDNFIYVAGGRYFGGTVTDGFMYNDVMRYSPTDDNWVRCAQLPCSEVENMQAFRLGKSIYFVGGNNKYNEAQRAVYRIKE